MEECEYRFCPRCGNPFSRENETLLSCPSCSLRYYINARPCNAVILENKTGKILMVRRRFAPRKDAWDLPGGFVSIRETIEQSVVRELREELGATVTGTVYFGSYADTYLFGGITYHTVGLVFTGKIGDTKTTPLDDASEIRFFAKDEVLKQDIAFRSVKKALTDYLGRKKVIR